MSSLLRTEHASSISRHIGSRETRPAYVFNEKTLSVSCPHNLPPVYRSLPFPHPQNVTLTHPTHDPLRRAQTTFMNFRYEFSSSTEMEKVARILVGLGLAFTCSGTK